MSDVSPLLFIAMGVFAVSIIIIAFATIPEPHLQKAGEKKEVMDHSPLNFRHTLLGIIAIFFYVGIEVGIPSQLTFYLAQPESAGGVGLANGAAIGGVVGIRPLRGHAAQDSKAQHQRSQRERHARPASFSLVRNHCMLPSGQPRTSITFIGASPFCWFAA